MLLQSQVSRTAIARTMSSESQRRQYQYFGPHDVMGSHPSSLNEGLSDTFKTATETDPVSICDVSPDDPSYSGNPPTVCIDPPSPRPSPTLPPPPPVSRELLPYLHTTFHQVPDSTRFGIHIHLRVTRFGALMVSGTPH